MLPESSAPSASIATDAPLGFARDAPLFAVLNAGSGADDAEEARSLVSRVLEESGRAHDIAVVKSGDDLVAIARRAVAAAKSRGGAVVAAGGDGTINTVAQVAHEAECPMGVLPRGTFNYFSRAHGIPSDLEEATRALCTTRLVPVQIGLVNDRVFLVNASLGLYPQILEDREAFEARFGRNRFVSGLAAIGTLLREHRQLRLRIEQRGVAREVRTPTLFVGNNRLQLDQVGIAHEPDRAGVTAVMVKPVRTWAMLRLFLRGMTGTLGDADRIESFQFQRMTVTPWHAYGSRRVKVATDGEVHWMRSPLEFRVAPKPLYLLKPFEDVATTERASERDAADGG